MVQPVQQSLPNISTSFGVKSGLRRTLFNSDLYTIGDFSSNNSGRTHFGSGYTGEFCINFPKQGYYIFNSFRRRHEEYNSQVLIEKPGCEFTLTQQAAGYGACSIFRFNDSSYAAIKEQYHLRDCSFFSNENIFSVLLKTSPEAGYLHHRVLQELSMPDPSRLEVDRLVMEMVTAVMILLGTPSCNSIPESHKKHHLITIERAREYLFENFTRDVSLLELARHCYVSVFHFSRIFKQFTGYSPYQYLRQIRLKHAERLIRTTDLPVTDICFQSGFNRLDYFSTAFAKKYGVAPSRYKATIA